MSRRRRHSALWLMLCLATVVLAPAAMAATGLQELIDQGHVEITSSVEPQRGIVPGQRVNMQLQVATDTWFTGGTRIAIPEVPGLVILQTDQFAANASENRDGVSWVLQRWTLDLYPQRAGRFQLPPIRLSLKVSGGDAGSVEGDAFAPPLDVEIALPAALERAEHWVAAPSFSAEQHFDREPDNLQVGDALQRRVVFEAQDLMAMMLPALREQAIDGLAAYPEPPALNNSNNRGELRATRTESISYIAEAPGDYVLPALEFLWWNTDRAELQVVELPAVNITVTGGAATKTGDSAVTARHALLATGTVLALLLLAWLGRLLLPWLPWAQIRAGLAGVYEWLASLRRPALPSSLNPGSNAAD